MIRMMSADPFSDPFQTQIGEPLIGPAAVDHPAPTGRRRQITHTVTHSKIFRVILEIGAVRLDRFTAIVTLSAETEISLVGKIAGIEKFAFVTVLLCVAHIAETESRLMFPVGIFRNGKMIFRIKCLF